MKWHLTVEIDEQTIREARAAYPNTFPKGSPRQWTGSDLRKALDVIASLPNTSSIVRVAEVWEEVS